jgi:hypothetical protein
MGNAVHVLRPLPTGDDHHRSVESSGYYREAVCHIAQMCHAHEKIDMENCFPVFALMHHENLCTLEVASHLSRLINIPLLDARDLNEEEFQTLWGSCEETVQTINNAGSEHSYVNTLRDVNYCEGVILFNCPSLQCLSTLQKIVSPQINAIKGICLGIKKEEVRFITYLINCGQISSFGILGHRNRTL